MKVIHVIDSLGSGGKERQLVELLKGLQPNKNINCQVALFNRHIHYLDIIKMNIPVHYLNHQGTGCLSILTALIKLCKKSKPDIVHTWGHKPTRYIALVAKLLKIKLVNFSIQYARPIKKFSRLWWYGKLTFPLSDMVVANSRAGLTIHNLKESQKHRLVYNGFDSSRINTKSPSSIKDDLNLGSNYIVGMVANFLEGKDYQTLIKAGQKLLENRRDIVFLFIGDGPTKEEMEKLVKKEFKNRLLFLGNRTDVEEIVRVIDVGILLAKQDHAEGISNTIMEYMALAKPVIATDVGGNKELVLDGGTGFLIPYHDIDMLINKLTYLLNNPDLREKMGKRGSERIWKVFSLEKMVFTFMDIYRSLAPLTVNQNE